ncbi:group II intron reverse transcriptase/maturase [Scytonema sp. PRP1]|uniref:group II intron reverse transcriptase/maturase n=1 Tax=Scytonema sp. PRP1 TaxID=3120513 RepID=UPI00300DB35E
MVYTSLKTTETWASINWRKLERQVYKMQKRIYQASQRSDVKTVHNLQRLLMSSRSAKLLAVRRISQDNQGKKTAGVDGIKNLSPAARLTMIVNLKLSKKASPTRRVWIPKPGTDEKRPLGIPTMHDRAMQALVKLALEPEWEAQFEPNSYGFRPGRSCHDAIEAIFIGINHKPKYVLDADISKCFDRIDHQALLLKLNTTSTIRRQVAAWLKSGGMDGKQLFPTSEGTPQGGVISPLLANIALHGLESRVKQEFPKMSHTGRETWFHKKGTEFKSPDVIRYADDFVILHENETVVLRCKEVISEWLLDMGLELKPSKTRFAHTLQEYKLEKPGFDFLGFTIRQFSVGKYHSKQGYKTIITPSSKKQKIHYDKIAEVIESHKALSQAALIAHLNPIIRGWTNYYATVVSKVAYSELDNLVYQKLRAWAKRRHPKKSGEWVSNKYWHSIGGDNWVFSTKNGDNFLKLIDHAQTPIIRHIKVKGKASPLDGNLVYWSSRMGKNPELPSRVTKLLKKQKGKCAHCGLFFRESDVMEVDHIIPKSKDGKDCYENWQLMHRHCHDTKTTNDGNIGAQSGCNSTEPLNPTRRLEKVEEKWVMRYA